MKFLSIKEYFYKINTIGFILLLLPMVVFIILYVLAMDQSQPIVAEESVFVLLGGVVVVFLIDLTVVRWLIKIRLNKYQKLPELARKMDGFFSLSVIHMATYCGGALLSAAGFFLTQHSYFTGLFILIDLIGILQWPTPKSFCNTFKLQGSEREMVMMNKDLLEGGDR